MLLLRTLGEVRLEGGDTTPLSSRRKELLLLAYLARRPSRSSSRAELAGLLWPDRDDTRARQSLRQAVLELKRLVGEGMMLEADRIVLADNAITVDATAFEGDLASGRFSQAVERWRGDFLAGTEDLGGEQFRVWLEAEREGLRRRLHSALHRLIEDARQHGAWSEAIGWAERWVEYLPFDPDGFFQLVDLLHLGGRTDEALARHGVFLTRLRTDLEVEPSAEFLRLGARVERSAAAPSITATAGSSALFTPDLVQRGPALAELVAAWQRARGGGASVVLVEGEAGIGKTRLCDAFVRDVEDEPSASVLRVLGQGSDQSIELAAARAFVAGLSRSPGLGGASAPALAELAGLSPAIGHRFPSLQQPTGGESQQVEALREALTAVAEECPIVVYIDDFQLMDGQSQALIAKLIARVDAGVLFLLTARTGEEAWSPTLSRLTQHPGLRRLKLQALDVNGVEALLGSMLQLPPADRHPLAHRLHEHGGGNPFYIIELTSALVDEGLLVPTETGSWRLAGRDGHSLPLPATLREVIGRRLARLSPEARITSEGAAVLGRTFDPELVPVTAGQSPATCAVAMEELIARKLVREAPLSPGMCEFTHDLIGRVAYELLTAPRREELHRAASRAWEAKARRNPAAQTALAYHRGRAGLPVSTPWWKRRTVAPAVAAALGIVLLAISLAYQTRKPATLVTERILVAPFDNLTGDSRLDHLGTMAADWLTQGITDAAMMQVVDSRTAIMADRTLAAQSSETGRADRVRNLADATGARRVIWGSIYRRRDSLFFQTQISEAKTWQVLRTMDPVGAPATDPARAIGLLRQRVVGALALMYNAKVSSWFAQAGRPPTYEAYQAFMEGADLHVQYKLVEAADHYRRAFALDSTFVQPLLWAGDAYRQADSLAAADSVLRIAERLRNRLSPFDRHFLANQRGSLAGDYGASLAAAREMARIAPGSEAFFLLGSEALGLNRPREALDAFAQVNSEHGFLKGWDGFWGWPMLAYHLLGMNDSALVVARRGRLQYPSSRQALLHEVLVLAAMGREDDLEHLFNEAAGLPAQSTLPLGKILKGAAVELRGHGHTEASRRIAARAAALLSAADSSSEGDANRRTLVEALYLCDRWTDAAPVVALMLRQHPDDINWLGLHATVAARLGERGEALRVDSVLGADTRPYRYGQTALWRARIRAVVGDVEPAVSLLRSALARGLGLDFFLHANVDFEPLRNDPKFRELLRPKG